MILAGSKFKIDTNGLVITTPAYNEIADKLTTQEDFQREMQALLHRHINGDWGDVDPHDARVNEQAVKSGARIVSSYTVEGIKLWIISDAAYYDTAPELRQVTTFLLPSDY